MYWFRTPPGVKVGRSALDQEAIQLIESLNPDLEFDWTRILKGEGVEDKRQAAERRGADAGRERAGSRGKVRREAAASLRGRAPASASEPRQTPVEQPAPLEPRSSAVEAAPGASAEPEAPLPDGPRNGELVAPPLTPAHARLGGEGVSRLRARYAEMLARIAERVTDPARQEELNALAERLNPDGWVTGEEVAAALEAYEGVFAALRTAVGPRRRRRRRSRKPDAAPGAGVVEPQAADHPADLPAASAVEEADDAGDFEESES